MILLLLLRFVYKLMAHILTKLLIYVNVEEGLHTPETHYKTTYIAVE